MGKTAACIKIIQILSCRDIVPTNELADLLEINPRNIKEYIKELEEVGYTIESVKGIYGGYKLDKRETLPAFRLSDDEKETLINATSFLNGASDYLEVKEFNLAMGKVMATFNSSNTVTPVTMIDRYPLAIDKNLLTQRYNFISECIEGQYKCNVTYLPASNQPKEHVLHPYKLFAYNGSWFVLAWSERVNNYGYYKLNRMENIIPTKNHFSRSLTFNETEYLDDFGMKQNGEYYHIELKLKDLKTVMQERIYGKNQKIEEIDEHYIKFICDMQNKNNIMSFILSFGSKCQVLEPLWLVEDVKKELEGINSLYNNLD